MKLFVNNSGRCFQTNRLLEEGDFYTGFTIFEYIESKGLYRCLSVDKKEPVENPHAGFLVFGEPYPAGIAKHAKTSWLPLQEHKLVCSGRAYAFKVQLGKWYKFIKEIDEIPEFIEVVGEFGNGCRG